MMLEEVEMPPRVLLEVMRLARGTALRARIQRSSVGTDLQMELGWRMFCIKALTHNFPRWRETKTQGEYLFGKHGNPPEGGLSKLGEVGQFHIKRRRTKQPRLKVAPAVVARLKDSVRENAARGAVDPCKRLLTYSH
jgi:hypothetical protein